VKATDYIIDFLSSKGITDMFGYPGGVICHLMDSASKYSDSIKAHTNYHEQGAAFAACGYAQSSKKPGVAYATSGPGATNLVTGIANAYFDSVPAIFITGQVDTYAVKGDLNIRQRGFQETDIVSIVKSVTKYCVYVENPEKLRYYIEKAYWMATNGRPGPVLLDIPADVQRSEIQVEEQLGFFPDKEKLITNIESVSGETERIVKALQKSKRPCFLIGSGIKQSGQEFIFRKIAEKLNIPVVSSMPAFDLLPYKHKLNFGFVGANGHRYANFVLGKSDLVITLGSRLDLKQVGNNRSLFASNARLIRIDVDAGELTYKVRDDEEQIVADLKNLIPDLALDVKFVGTDYDEWVDICEIIRDKLKGIDEEIYHKLIAEVSERVPENVGITADVGHHEVWVAQSYRVKENQSVYISGGLGSMGYSLPAAIGIYYGSKLPVICFNGDGGLQMNIQELQFIRRENLPIKVIVINNYALGMIRHFQEKNFNANYVQTTNDSGYTAPDFSKIAAAYELDYYRVERIEDVENIDFCSTEPALIEICVPINTYLVPNFGYKGPLHDQDPPINRELYDYIMSL